MTDKPNPFTDLLKTLDDIRPLRADLTEPVFDREHMAWVIRSKKHPHDGQRVFDTLKEACDFLDKETIQ